MDDHDAQRWPSEALQAMRTHLCLLHAPGDKLAITAAEQVNPLSVPALDLDCGMPLPDGWEQFLDIRTGQVYYIDWKTCRRSYVDPRKSLVGGAAGIRNAETESSQICDSASSSGDAGGDNDHDHDHLMKTFPMCEADWQLMESRGWALGNSSDDRSEISIQNESSGEINS